MAPQTSIPLPATILGLIGTICWCIQLIPQIWTNFRTKNTEGLPASMLLLWACSGVPFSIYAILQNLNIPIQVQPQVFTLLSLVTWAQCLHYNSCWSVFTSFGLATLLGFVFAGIEAAVIIPLQPKYRNHQLSESALLVIGIIASVLLGLGLLPPYREIWKRGGRVLGINFLFLFVDWLGAFFSLMSLVAQNEFDLLGGVMYIVVLALESGIFVAQAVWWLFLGGRRVLKAEKEEMMARDALKLERSAGKYEMQASKTSTVTENSAGASGKELAA